MMQFEPRGKRNPMRNSLKLTRCGMTALLLAAGMLAGIPTPARAQSDPDLTSKLLIAILVKKGVLTQSDANSILEEAQAAAAAAQASVPPAPALVSSAPVNTAPGGVAQTGTMQTQSAPASTVMVSSTESPDGTVHVTYIPQVVRDQIADAVTAQMTAKQQAAGNTGLAEVPDWVNQLHFYGDFRLRYEDDLFPHGNDDTGAFPNFNAINTGAPYDVSAQNSNFPPSLNVDENRDRLRLRARLGVLADLGDGFNIGIRLATGENDSPVTENQTLGGAPGGSQGGNFAKDAVWIDRAYLSYTPNLDIDLAMTLEAGRFDNPFFTTNMIWADDIGFDGVAALATYQLDDNVTPYLTAGAFPVYNTDFNFASNQPAKFPNNNKWLYAVQAGSNVKFSDDYAAKFGIGDYLFTNVAGKLSAPCTVLTTADGCSTDDDRPSFAQNGNSYMSLRNIIPTTANDNGTIDQYQYFGLASGFNELAFTGEFDARNFDPTDIWLVGEYVHNLAFNKQDIANKAVNNRGGTTISNAVGGYEGGDNGFYVNVNVGAKQLTQRWDWNAMLGYKYIESDAVVDAFNDSDFGLGGTNLKGYILSGNVALEKNVWVRLRYMSADSIVGPPYKSDVFQFDLNAKF